MSEPGPAHDPPCHQRDEEIDDTTLVARAKRDREAFALLYARYLTPVLRFCESRLGDHAEAEDATSQIFAKAMVALPSCRDQTFRAWLFTIARNVVTDTFRTRRPASSLDAVGDLTAPEPGPDILAVVEDERRRLRDLLTHLTPDQRRVVELRLAGLTGKEIAGALSMSIPAVKTHQFRAIARLRDVLGVGIEPKSKPSSRDGAAEGSKGVR